MSCKEILNNSREQKMNEIKKLTSKEIKAAGNIYCPYCKPDKVVAIWRVNGWYDFNIHVACDKHRDKLVEPNSGGTTGIY